MIEKYVIYSDFHSEGIYFIVDEKVMLEKTSLSEFISDYSEYNRAERSLELSLINLFEAGGNEKYEIFICPAPEFLIGTIKRKGDVLPYKVD